MLSVLRDTADVSAGSDQLASFMQDWVTTYHFSRLRRNLIAPLPIKAGMRVLDVGCGTGTILRAIGELGADAVGLEGTPARAHAARERCRDLLNVEVQIGFLQDFDDADGFDWILLVGVLEYADPSVPGGAPAMLAAAHRLLRSGGRLVVAIENQIGLKYIIGYDESHDGVPWTGLEGYRRGGPARTYSRRRLDELLEGAGFASREWLYPFPDYKLPRLIATDRFFEHEHADVLTGLFLRSPVANDSGEPRLVADAARCMRVFEDAGLARDLSNSFLVVAGDDAPVSDDDAPLLWVFGDERANRWLRTRTLTSDGCRLVCDEPRTTTAEWLQQVIPTSERVVLGENVADLVVDAVVRGDAERTYDLLGAWSSRVMSIAPALGEIAEPNPFAPENADCIAVSGVALDCVLSNFVRTDDGTIHHVDLEWRAAGLVDADFVRMRALVYFVLALQDKGIQVPWLRDDASPLHAAEVFARGTSLEPPHGWFDRLLSAEAEFQSLVTGNNVKEQVQALLERADVPWDVQVISNPFMTLADAHRHLLAERQRAIDLKQELVEMQQENLSLKSQVGAQGNALNDILTSPTWRIAETVKTPLRRFGLLTHPRSLGDALIIPSDVTTPRTLPIPTDEITTIYRTDTDFAGENVAVIAAYDVRRRYGTAVEHMVRSFTNAGWRTVVSYSTAIDEVPTERERRLPNVLIARDHAGAGYDFYSWRVALETCPELRSAKTLLMINDSVIGPIAPIDPLLKRLEDATTNVIGFVESAERCPHLQSWGIAYSGQVITEGAVESYYGQVGVDWPKANIITTLEVPLSSRFVRRGYTVEAICSPVSLGGEQRNPSIFGWQRLVRAGIPFIKRELFTLPEETIQQRRREVFRQAALLTTVDLDLLIRDSAASVGATVNLHRGRQEAPLDSKDIR